MSESPSKLSRRRALAGAGTAGALAAAAVVLHKGQSAPAPVAATPQPAAEPSKGDGYQVTPHVLRYYQTTRI
ncbi:formate dehydrogenase [Azohydromonas aeria]|uniref:formate dehydrogenase n=1 Tax=Azohydromonas aeria TaxID=2590212 RepID=UPI0012FC74D8|nr:formate dehydrogenase [Azohydromonas aeria]